VWVPQFDYKDCHFKWHDVHKSFNFKFGTVFFPIIILKNDMMHCRYSFGAYFFPIRQNEDKKLYHRVSSLGPFFTKDSIEWQIETCQ
jgi:hypothetical protein